ncbi:MAG: hypothetical protein ACYDCO_17585 [Armatimonadota bacterium]
MSEVAAVVMIYLTWAAGMAVYFAVLGRLFRMRETGAGRALTLAFVVCGGLFVWVPVLPVLLAGWLFAATH